MTESESDEVALDVCRARAAHGWERWYQVENVGRVLFTGEGIHPVLGTIAPGNGFAGGLSVNHEFNTHSLRWDLNTEGRASWPNHSWALGLALGIMGSTPNRQNQHAHATVSLEHLHLNEVSFFGIGSLSPDRQTEFGLATTTARLTLESAAERGLSFFGTVEALQAQPLAGSGTSPVRQQFTEATAPGLATSTMYLVVGGGARWQYPEDEVSSGYTSGASASIRWFNETEGRPYSFRRADFVWTNGYTPDWRINGGTFTANVRMTVAGLSDSNRIPYYLQPTLGGTDIDGQGGLRSYHDYRFRAPDILLAQLGYERTVFGPFGLIGFYDVGNVGPSLHDLRTSAFKHSLGLGITFRVGNAVVGELYYAWGGAEGSRGNFTGNSNAMAVDPLGGVF